ncbi:4-hydroxybenzoyl-CoA reductase subunit beta [Rhodospirillaceae bacterium LM-1]|nr:4-hydroxybenzoyl-CoA reductase subunit beta [Rhodospirillaceae bacterium LM-1]
MNLLPDFNLLRANSIDEAVAALSQEGVLPIAGGTDLLPNLRRGLGEPKLLVDLSQLGGLSKIEPTADGGLRIGALVSLEALAESPLTPDAVKQAALGVAGPTHRAQGTLGGNLCQDTRCVFYNQSDWWREGNEFCLKYRGSKCHVVTKSDRCYATYHGDVAPALMVLNASAEIVGPDGQRTLLLADLFKESGAEHLTLKHGEILTNVVIPTHAGWQAAYEKARVREAIEFPLAGVAVALKKDGGKIAGLRVAITGANSAPLMVPTGDLIGMEWNQESSEILGKAVRKVSNVLKSTVTGPKYRRRMLLKLAQHLVDKLWLECASAG